MDLEVKNISKHYGAVVAIKRADISVKSGEVRAILGGNGSGKSTLAKVVSGLINHNTGEIYIDGKQIEFSSPEDAKSHHVIMTSQELSLFKNLTVEENICICNLPRKGAFTDRKEVKERAKQILERMKLSHLMGELVMNLAPDQQYMVELAKAIVQEPKILMIDEITSALYREEVDIVDEIIRDLKQQGCSILFISHRMSELYAMCDSVTIMKNGETLGTYAITEKTEDEYGDIKVVTEDGYEIVFIQLGDDDMIAQSTDDDRRYMHAFAVLDLPVAQGIFFEDNSDPDAQDAVVTSGLENILKVKAEKEENSIGFDFYATLIELNDNMEIVRIHQDFDVAQ